MNRNIMTNAVEALAFFSSLLAATGILAGCSAGLDFTECKTDTDCARFATDGVTYQCRAQTCASATTAGKLPRIAYLYIGPVGDYGWTKTHDEGRLALDRAFPTLDTTFQPSVSPADAPAAIRKFIDDGYDLIIGTSFDFLGSIQNAAANNPKVNFLLTSGFITSPNLGSYFGRMYQAKWLAGRLAAQMSVSKKLGYVSSVLIPETIRHVNAFTLGARSIDPTIQVAVTFIGEWFNPANEEAAANAILDAGIDVITNGTDTPVTIEVADTRKTLDGRQVLSIGYDNPDTCDIFAPESCIASAYYNWEPILTDIVTAIRDGSWDPQTPIWEPMTGDSGTSTVYLTPANPALVPSGVRIDVESYISKFASGSFDAFRGAVRDNKGTTRSPLDDDDLLRMCWFVEGVVEVSGDNLLPKVVPSGCPGDY